MVAGVNLEHAVLFKSQRVDWLELEMQHAGSGVGRGNPRFGAGQRRTDIAAAGLKHRPGLGIGNQCRAAVLDGFFRHVDAVTASPDHLDQIGGANRSGCAAGDDHHPARHRPRRIIEREALKIALHCLGRRIVDRDNLGAITCRWQFWPGMDHAGHLGIDAEDGAAIGLGRNVDGVHRLADQASFGDGLDRQGVHVLGCKTAGDPAACHDLAIGNRPSAGDNLARTRRARRRCNAQQLCPRLDQRDAPGRTSAAEDGEGLPYRPAAAGDHQAPFRIGVDMDDAHLVPIGLQFVGQDARQRRPDMLAHFRPDDVDRHHAIGSDAEPHGRFKARRDGRWRYRVPGDHRRVRERGKTKGRAATGRRHQKAAPRKRMNGAGGRVAGASHWRSPSHCPVRLPRP